MESDDPSAGASLKLFALFAVLFVGSALLPTLMALVVLGHIQESGLSANLGWGGLGLFPAAVLLGVEAALFVGMIWSGKTPLRRKLLIPAALLLAFDATLLIGFAMNASGC